MRKKPFILLISGTNWLLGGITRTMEIVTDEKYDSSLLFGGGGLGARFLFGRKGLSDGFFAEPRVTLGYSKYSLTKESVSLIDSKSLTITPALVAGYSWFFDNGFYASAGVMVGLGIHAKNTITVDGDLKSRLKDKAYLRNRLWADEGRLRFDYGGDISLGYAF